MTALARRVSSEVPCSRKGGQRSVVFLFPLRREHAAGYLSPVPMIRETQTTVPVSGTTRVSASADFR